MKILWVAFFIPKDKENKDISFKNTMSLKKTLNCLSQLVSQDIEVLTFSVKREQSY